MLHPRLAPAHIAFVHAIPVSVFGRQQAPLGAAAGDPQHRFDEVATVVYPLQLSCLCSYVSGCYSLCRPYFR
jgi:hypothetical protein